MIGGSFAKRRAWLGAALLLAGGCVVGAACSAPSKGALILAISTDMQTPKDLSVISVFITTNSVVKYDYLGSISDGTVSLPSTLAIEEPDQQGAQVRIRVIGFQGQTARVLRDVLTTVPHQRTSLLHLTLNFLDDGSATGSLPSSDVPGGPGGAPDGITDFDPDTILSGCDFTQQQTSVAGQCVTAAVNSGGLPPYKDSLVFGDGGPTTGSCFDVQGCFVTSKAVTALDTTGCTFPLPEGADATQFNVAFATADQTGAPVGSQYLVPLENDPDDCVTDPSTGGTVCEGWKIQGGSVQMAPGVCKKLQASKSQLYFTSGSCAPKTESNPVCQPKNLDAGTGNTAFAVPPQGSSFYSYYVGGYGNEQCLTAVGGNIFLCGGTSDLTEVMYVSAQSGGTANVVETYPSSSLWGFFTDSTNVYWFTEPTNTDGGVPDGGYEVTLHRMPAAGGAATAVSTFPDPGCYENYAFDGQDFYYYSCTTYQLYRLPASGGQPTAIGGTNYDYYYDDGTMVADPSPTGSLYELEYDYNGTGTTALVSTPKTGIPDGGAPTVLVPNLSDDYQDYGNLLISSDGSTLFITNGVEQNAQILSVPVKNPTPKPIASNLTAPFLEVTDGTSVYWISYTLDVADGGTPVDSGVASDAGPSVSLGLPDKIWSVGVNGGTPQVVYDSTRSGTNGYPYNLTVDSKYVYYLTDDGAEGLYRVAKPAGQ
jgi:hypothetical protein